MEKHRRKKSLSRKYDSIKTVRMSTFKEDIMEVKDHIRKLQKGQLPVHFRKEEKTQKV
jgi:hypothetical protein